MDSMQNINNKDYSDLSDFAKHYMTRLDEVEASGMPTKEKFLKCREIFKEYIEEVERKSKIE